MSTVAAAGCPCRADRVFARRALVPHRPGTDRAGLPVRRPARRLGPTRRHRDRQTRPDPAIGASLPRIGQSQDRGWRVRTPGTRRDARIRDRLLPRILPIRAKNNGSRAFLQDVPSNDGLVPSGTDTDARNRRSGNLFEPQHIVAGLGRQVVEFACRRDVLPPAR